MSVLETTGTIVLRRDAEVPLEHVGPRAGQVGGAKVAREQGVGLGGAASAAERTSCRALSATRSCGTELKSHPQFWSKATGAKRD